MTKKKVQLASKLNQPKKKKTIKKYQTHGQIKISKPRPSFLQVPEDDNIDPKLYKQQNLQNEIEEIRQEDSESELEDSQFSMHKNSEPECEDPSDEEDVIATKERTEIDQKLELEYLICQEKAKQLMVMFEFEELGVIQESREVDEESSASYQQNF